MVHEMKKYIRIFPRTRYFLFALCAYVAACGKSYAPEQQAHIAAVEKSRREKDEWMKNDPSSPFKRDTTAHYSPLKYFDVNPDFVFSSRLYENERKDTVIIFGTKGEERKVVKYGYVLWLREENESTINVYKGIGRTGKEYYSIWFTDRTTGQETYDVGRYLDFELDPDPAFLYTIDFNAAYNPYCAYSAQFSCAVPAKEDHLDIAIEAGEKNFH